MICEFYLHNYVVASDSEWNPLLYIGDIHIKALMSWIQNEISMGAQAKAYKDFEFDCPLALRKEEKEPRVLYYEWHKLLVRNDVRNLVLPMRE